MLHQMARHTWTELVYTSRFVFQAGAVEEKLAPSVTPCYLLLFFRAGPPAAGVLGGGTQRDNGFLGHFHRAGYSAVWCVKKARPEPVSRSQPLPRTPVLEAVPNRRHQRNHCGATLFLYVAAFSFDLLRDTSLQPGSSGSPVLLVPCFYAVCNSRVEAELTSMFFFLPGFHYFSIAGEQPR